jgi:hypothetical protein
MRIISNTNVNGVQRIVIQSGDQFFSVRNNFHNDVLISSVLNFLLESFR